jgi:hypothetical protein
VLTAHSHGLQQHDVRGTRACRSVWECASCYRRLGSASFHRGRRSLILAILSGVMDTLLARHLDLQAEPSRAKRTPSSRCCSPSFPRGDKPSPLVSSCHTSAGLTSLCLSHEALAWQCVLARTSPAAQTVYLHELSSTCKPRALEWPIEQERVACVRGRRPRHRTCSSRSRDQETLRSGKRAHTVLALCRACV